MPAPRSAAPVIVAVALTLPAATAHAQGAGDDQYQDPFANSGSSSQHHSRPAAHRQLASVPTRSRSGGLSQSPPVSGTSPSSTAPAPAAPAAPAPSSAAPGATALPRTGLELPGMALLGVGLLASGVGLRLRTLDESLY